MDITHLRARTCTICGEVKLLSEFSKFASGAYGLRAFCKKCHVKEGAARRKLNPEKTKADRAAFHTSNSERICAASTAYYLANKEQILAKKKVYCTNNSDKIYAAKAKRRAIKLKALAPWANLKAIAVIYRESKLLREKTGVVYHVDHIIPLQHPLVCGLHVEYNLQILTKTENLEKSNHFEPGPHWLN